MDHRGPTGPRQQERARGTRPLRPPGWLGPGGPRTGPAGRADCEGDLPGVPLPDTQASRAGPDDCQLRRQLESVTIRRLSARTQVVGYGSVLEATATEFLRPSRVPEGRTKDMLADWLRHPTLSEAL